MYHLWTVCHRLMFTLQLLYTFYSVTQLDYPHFYFLRKIYFQGHLLLSHNSSTVQQPWEILSFNLVHSCSDGVNIVLME